MFDQFGTLCIEGLNKGMKTKEALIVEHMENLKPIVSEVFLEPCQTSKIKVFVNKVNG